MNAVIESHQAKIEQLCRKYHVRRLELFGSAATGNFVRDSSDIDLLVEFETLAAGERANAYFGLLESLEALFGCHVDLVMVTAIRNPYFLEAIESSRTLLYAA